tara:strand:- start:163 stop:333 length:171 start_codon:yes stop_codon:yes gene_type:complete
MKNETAICLTVDFCSADLFGRLNLHGISKMANEALDKSPYPAIHLFGKFLVFREVF